MLPGRRGPIQATVQVACNANMRIEWTRLHMMCVHASSLRGVLLVIFSHPGGPLSSGMALPAM
jgi:hypothetical protein